MSCRFPTSFGVSKNLVLVVDDDPGMLKAVQRLLRAHAFGRGQKRSDRPRGGTSSTDDTPDAMSADGGTAGYLRPSSLCCARGL